MPRKPNYGFDKRRKEQDRKARKDAKRLERQQRREQGAPEEGETLPPGETDTDVTPSTPGNAEPDQHQA